MRIRRAHGRDLRAVRAKSPVLRAQAYGGCYVLSGYADILRVVRDDEGFSLRAGTGT
jgi:hypothetical protein